MFPNFSARALGLDVAPEESLRLAADGGFTGVDLPVRDIVHSGTDLRLLRSRMTELNLRGGCWPLPVDWRGAPTRFEADLNGLPRYAEAAATLGLFRTGTWVLPWTIGVPGQDVAPDRILRETAEWHVRRLGSIARVLHRFEIRLGLEVIGVEASRDERAIPFVRRLADFDEHLGAIWDESPNFGLIVDGFHLYGAGEEIEAGLAWGVERIVSVHVADLPAGASPERARMRDDERGLPGENGAIDSRRILNRLSEHGYEGPITAEPFAKCRSIDGLAPSIAVRLVAAALQREWPSRIV